VSREWWPVLRRGWAMAMAEFILTDEDNVMSVGVSVAWNSNCNGGWYCVVAMAINGTAAGFAAGTTPRPCPWKGTPLQARTGTVLWPWAGAWLGTGTGQHTKM
jgi:hypothetical protein